MPETTLRRLMRERFGPTDIRPPKRPSLVLPPQYAPEPSFGELSIFEKGIDVLSRPNYAVASFANALQRGTNPFSAALEGLAGVRRTTFSDVLKHAGLQAGPARAIMGMAADVLADPLTWFGEGPLKAAGKVTTATLRGVPRLLTETAGDTLRSLTKAKTLQSSRILARGAERLTPLRTKILMQGMSPEARGLLEAGKITKEEALGASYGRKAFERVAGVGETRLRNLAGDKGVVEMVQPGAALHPSMAKLPLESAAKPTGAGMFAERYIKFAGMPIVRTAKVGEAVGAIPKALYRPLEKLPLAGKAFTGVKDFASKAGAALRRVFSTSTKYPEFDVARTTAREIEHWRNIKSSEWWKDYRRRLLDLTEPGNEKAIDRELANAIEGIEQEVLKHEVPADRIAAVNLKIEGFERRIRPLLKRHERVQAGIEGLKTEMGKVAARKATVYHDTVAQLAKVEPKLRVEAAMKGVREATEGQRALHSEDLLADIVSRTQPLTLDRNARKLIDPDTLKELVRSGAVKLTNKDFGVGDDLVEIAIKGGAESVMGEAEFAGVKTHDPAAMQKYVQDFVDGLLKAGETRARARDQVNALKRVLEDVKAGRAEADLPVEDLGAVVDRFVREGTEKRSAQIEAKLASLQKKLTKKQSAASKRKLEFRIGELHTEIAKQQEDLGRLGHPIDVTYRERVPVEPKTAGLKPLVKEFRERMDKIFEKEESTLAIPPEYRALYLPHVLRKELKGTLIDVIQQDPGRVVKREFREGLASSMRRSQQGGVSDVILQDLVDKGALDPAKVKKELEAHGVMLTSDDMLAFEVNPVVAGFKRELAHNRAVTAAEFAQDLFTSPVIVKAKVNLGIRARIKKLTQEIADLEAAKVKAEGTPRMGDLVEEIRTLNGYLIHAKAQWDDVVRVLAQHPRHSIFMPMKDFLLAFRTKEQMKAIRAGAESEIVNHFLKEWGNVADIDEAIEGIAFAEKPAGTIEAYIIPTEIGEHLSKAYELPNAPEAIKDFLDIFDKWQSYWKLTATVIRPAFHIRNAISNVWQNFLAGLTDPRLYFLAGQMQSNTKNLSKFARIGRWTAEQVYALAEQTGVMRGGFIGGDVGEWLERELRPVGWTPERGALKGVKGAGAIHPAGPIARFGQKWGTRIEDNARLALFIDGIQKGMDPVAAATRVKKYLFDYGDLTTYEKGIFRRIIPFYTWTRKSIPLALEMLIKQPGKVAVLGKARANAEKNIEGLDHEFVAEYINQSFGIPVKKNADGSYAYFLLKGYIPTVDLAKMDPTELLGMLSPFVKFPLETAFNTDFYRMKPIRRFPTEMVEFMGVPMPVNLAHLLRNAVFLSQLDREIFREGASPMKLLTSELSFRTQDQEPVSQMRRYVLSAQMEIGELRRAAERARDQGRNSVAAGLESRVAVLEARREYAKRKVLKLDPHAFKYERSDRVRQKPSAPAPSLDKVKRGLKLDSLIRQYQSQAPKRAMAGAAR